MRIGIAAWESLHSIAVGGVAVHVTELAAALERRGHEVHVFTRQGGSQPWDERIDGVWYHRCGFDLSPDFVAEVDNMCRSFVSRFDGVQRVSGRFDVFHAHDWLASNAMAWVQDGFGVPGVLTVHSTEYGRCGNQFFGGRSRWIMDHERQGTSRACRVVAVSHHLKREVGRLYQVPDWKVRVIYNGVQARRFDGFVDQGRVKQRYSVGPFDPMVLFVGRMTYQKGPDLLLGAAPYVLRYHPSARFVFAGDGDMRWHLEAEAHRRGIARACRFLGRRGDQELADIYRASDMVVVPSRNEPFGIVILEAWSAGKPVVASQNGGPAEIVWHEMTGLKVYDSAESIAWGVGELLKDMNRARWIGRNGRTAVETAFSWDAAAARTEKVYTN